jgi:hypothetical protein
MALTGAIINSIGALAILIGAFVQAWQAYQQHELHRRLGHVLMWRDADDYVVPMPPGIWAGVVAPVVVPEAVSEIRAANPATLRVAVCDEHHFEGSLPFLPTPRTIRDQSVTFSGFFGWQLIFLGGLLVLVGSILTALSV